LWDFPFQDFEKGTRKGTTKIRRFFISPSSSCHHFLPSLSGEVFMDEAIKQILMDPTKAQALILPSIQENPALQELATRVITVALTQTLRRLEEGLDCR
jgi:hypothetical protein